MSRQAASSLYQKGLLEKAKAHLPPEPQEDEEVSHALKDDPFSEFKAKEGPLEGKKFKLANQRILLTFKHHLPKEEYIADFTELIHFKPKFIRLAHETGDKVCPYEHTHIVIDFGKPFQTIDCRFFDYVRKDPTTGKSIKWVDEATGKKRKVIHPHIQLITSVKHFESAKRYLGKEDAENADLCAIECCLFDKVSACPDKFAALKLCKSASEASGMLTMYNNRPKEEVITAEWGKMTRWQLQMERILRMDPVEVIIPEQEVTEDFEYTEEDIARLTALGPPVFSQVFRKIIVTYDPGTNKGKTELGKQLWLKDPKRYYFMQGIAAKKDVAQQLKTALDRGWSGKVLIINITFTCADYNIYDTLESIRDGWMTTSKWEGEPVPMPLKHLVLLTNFMPDMSKMGENRWDVYTINDAYFLRKVPEREAWIILRKEKNARKGERASATVDHFESKRSDAQAQLAINLVKDESTVHVPRGKKDPFSMTPS